MAKDILACSPIVRSCLLPRIWRGIFLFAVLSGCAVAQAPSAAENFSRFTHSTASPETVLVPATSAAFSQFVTRPAGFDSGAEGYGQHYGVAIADNVGGKFIRDFAFPTVFRQDPIYTSDRSPAGVWHRIGHAALHSVVLDTSHRPNFSGLPASFAAAGMSDLYQPREQRTWSATLQRTGTNAGGYLLGDLLSEFRPELCALRKRIHLACK